MKLKNPTASLSRDELTIKGRRLLRGIHPRKRTKTRKSSRKTACKNTRPTFKMSLNQ